MEPEINGHKQSEGQEKETPVCLRCLHPVDPLNHYCPHCGEATGQLTPYIPFVNIRWQVSFWGQAWRQIWSSNVSFAGRVFRLFMIILHVPILLLGVIFKPWETKKSVDGGNDTESERDKGEQGDLF